MVGCYGLDDQNFKTLAGITIDGQSEDIYVYHAQNLTLNLDVKSDNDNPLKYEWSFGKINNAFPLMIDSTVISYEPNLNYTFTSPGEYVLRLMVDNNESIVFKNFRLHVQTGLDEGILILCDDVNDNSDLTFIKKRSPQEIEDNAQEIWDDIMTTVNPDHQLKAGKGLYISHYKENSALLISTATPEGTIYRLNPQTMELTAVTHMGSEFDGAYAAGFAGESSSSSAYNCFIIGSNGLIYQYDLAGSVVMQRADERYIAEHIREFSSKASREPLLFNQTTLMVPASAGKVTVLRPDMISTSVVPGGMADMKLLTISTQRVPSGAKFNIVYQSTTDPLKIQTINTTLALASIKAGASYTATSPVAMDLNSTMLTLNNTTYAYYNYKDKLYRWDAENLTSTLRLPSEVDYIKDAGGNSIIPAGEKICAMTVMRNPYTTPTPEILEYIMVATYNESRAGDKKGSVYIIDPITHTVVKKHEGVCKKPVSILYKFAI